MYKVFLEIKKTRWSLYFNRSLFSTTNKIILKNVLLSLRTCVKIIIINYRFNFTYSIEIRLVYRKLVIACLHDEAWFFCCWFHYCYCCCWFGCRVYDCGYGISDSCCFFVIVVVGFIIVYCCYCSCCCCCCCWWYISWNATAGLCNLDDVLSIVGQQGVDAGLVTKGATRSSRNLWNN